MNSMKIAAFVATGIALLLAGCGDTQQPSKTANAAVNGVQLKEWTFPDAEFHRGTTKGNFIVGDYATSKSFEDVWIYYAKKVGYKGKYDQNLTHSEGHGSSGKSGGGNYHIQILNSTNNPAAAKARRPSAKSATLTRRGDGGNVTIFISRAKDEKKTYFTLVVEGK